MERYRAISSVVLTALVCACTPRDSISEPLPAPPAVFGGGAAGSFASTRPPPVAPRPPGVAVARGGAGPASAGDGASPPAAPLRQPAPIQGGTLLIARDGKAVVSDPDRDRVMLVDVAGAQVLSTFALEDGDEPGRAAEDDAGNVHVVLRRAGQVITIDRTQNRVSRRVAVCSMPEGIAFDAAAKQLHVACGDGQLVSLGVDGDAALRRVIVDTDLRDVFFARGKLFVTRFKSAEVLGLDADGKVISRVRPSELKGPFSSPSFGMISNDSKRFEAAVAWRTVAAPNGRIAMIHQRGQIDAIELHRGSVLPPQALVALPPIGGSRALPPGPSASAGVGGFAGPGLGGEGSAYGSGFGCDGIVQSGVTYLGDDGEVAGPLVPAMVLPVDAAISPDGHWLAIATPGSYQSRGGKTPPFGAIVMPMGLHPLTENEAPAMPVPFGAGGQAASFSTAGTGGQAMPLPSGAGGHGATSADAAVTGQDAMSSGDRPFGTGQCLLPGQDAPGQALNMGQAVAVAFDARGRLVVQTRDPNQLLVTTLNGMNCVGCETYDAQIDLGGVPARAPGHDLFHLNAGGGLACASCHPGGGDDGRTWQFAGIGPRRTQLFNMGVRDTLPLHWDGEFANMNELLIDVFVNRMGAQNISLQEGEAIEDYLDTLRPNTPRRVANDEAAVRGKVLFESKDVGCTECHNGPKLTNNKTVDVGTGGMFQVPSLIGVVWHEPYIHNGCAKTLRDRFTANCGGEKHGNTAALTETQLGDLIAYLESL